VTMPTYSPAPEVEAIAKDIIDKIRPYLGHVKITYLWRPEAAISDDKVVAGMCIRVDDRNRVIHDQDFIIEIAKDVWDESPTDEFKRALVDHELGHAGLRMEENGDVIYDEKTTRPKTYIKKHDIEEFEDVLERHGPYHKNLRSFLDAFGKHKAAQKKKKPGPDPIGSQGPASPGTSIEAEALADVEE